MSDFRSSTRGVTLLESLLAIAIGAAILLMSLRVYQAYQDMTNVARVNLNIDALFAATANFYYANCNRGQRLDPSNNPAPPTSFSTTIANLKSQGFLSRNYPVASPLVDARGGTDYVIQLNENLLNKTICLNAACTSTVDGGQIVIWKIQVSVRLKNSSKAELYKNMFGADCVSSQKGSNIVSCAEASVFARDCQNFIATGQQASIISNQCSTDQDNYNNYLVFERSPSFVTSGLDNRSSLYLSTPLMQQYMQTMTTNSITDLTTRSHTPEFQFYYCSG